jgi:energy-coupling factor transporter ATP-binding protein EcfA2/uncharacterized protein YbaR (Trm112 family)
LRLQQLEIHETRGVRDFTLLAEGKSIVILGPNGTGKSSIADALDFLLTGRIGRLTGEGSEGIALREVGPHLETAPNDCWVAGTFSLPGSTRTIQVKRRFSRPSRLEIEEESRELIQPSLDLAERGQHLLTRRELLRYIIARAQTRARRVGALLKLEKVEHARQAVVRASGAIDRKSRTASDASRGLESNLSATAGLPAFSEAELLAEINRLLGALGGGPVRSLEPQGLYSAIQTLPPQQTSPTPTRQEVSRVLEVLKSAQTPERMREVENLDSALRTSLTSVNGNAELLRRSRTLEVVRASVSLVDESGRCPVCDTIWEPFALRSHLTEKIALVEASIPGLARIEAEAQPLRARLDVLITALEGLEASCQRGGFLGEASASERWRSELRALRQLLDSPVTSYPTDQFPKIRVATLLWPEEMESVIARLTENLLPNLPKVSGTQDARDQLTRLGTLLEQLDGSRRNEAELLRANELAATLQTEFEFARDASLDALYAAVAGGFLEYYRALHPLDAEDVTAALRPTGAGLDLEVGYHGLGPFPPHAIHSEGHQDSMGLCLFLALSEHLTKGVLEMMILDDVLTSIDSEHRRAAARLLARLGESRQFVILTHDPVWARQLRSAGLVPEKRIWRITGWSLAGGPIVAAEGDWWGDIRRFLQASDVPSAASALRRNLEYLLGESCESLRARLPFQVDAQPEFGELYSALVGRVNDLLSKAKLHANSVKNQALLETLRIRHTAFREASQQIAREQWVINLSVHFNQFIVLTPNEVLPAVEAFERMFDQLICPSCHGLLSVMTQNNLDAVVICPCRSEAWPLPPRDSLPQAPATGEAG